MSAQPTKAFSMEGPSAGIFLGYMARKPWRPQPAWDPDGKTGVIEACSVSDCMCERVPEWEQLPAGPGPEDLEDLGFDVVGLGTCLPPFEHSPLACNAMAKEEPVNRWCLIDELARARSLATSWNVDHGVRVEPGRYFVVRVAREPSATPRGSKG